MNSKQLYLAFIVVPWVLFVIIAIALIATWPMVNPWLVICGIITIGVGIASICNHEETKKLVESFYD